MIEVFLFGIVLGLIPITLADYLYLHIYKTDASLIPIILADYLYLHIYKTDAVIKFKTPFLFLSRCKL